MTITGVLFQLFQLILSFNAEYRNITDNTEVLCVPPGGHPGPKCFLPWTPPPIQGRKASPSGVHSVPKLVGGPRLGPFAPHDHVANGDSCPCFTTRDTALQDVTASSHRKACHPRKGTHLDGITGTQTPPFVCSPSRGVSTWLPPALG